MSNPWVCQGCGWPVPGEEDRCLDCGAVRLEGTLVEPLRGWRVFLFRAVPYAAAGAVLSFMAVAFVGGVIVQLSGDDALPGVVATVVILAMFSPLAGAAIGIGEALMKSSSEQAAHRDRVDRETA